MKNISDSWSLRLLTTLNLVQTINKMDGTLSLIILYITPRTEHFQPPWNSSTHHSLKRYYLWLEKLVSSSHKQYLNIYKIYIYSILLHFYNSIFWVTLLWLWGYNLIHENKFKWHLHNYNSIIIFFIKSIIAGKEL